MDVGLFMEVKFFFMVVGDKVDLINVFISDLNIW